MKTALRFGRAPTLVSEPHGEGGSQLGFGPCAGIWRRILSSRRALAFQIATLYRPTYLDNYPLSDSTALRASFAGSGSPLLADPASNRPSRPAIAHFAPRLAALVAELPQILAARRGGESCCSGVSRIAETLSERNRPRWTRSWSPAARSSIFL